MAYRTGQERVDQMTMSITNPNVVGSGYIEHPPQRPFQDRVLVQPATVKPEDIPEWYDAQGVLHHGPRPAGYGGGRGGQGTAPRGGYGTGRGHQQRGGGVPGYHAAPQPRQPQYRPAPQQPRPAAPPQQPRPVAPPPQPRPHYGAPTAPGVFDTSTLMNTLQQTAVPPPAARPAAPAPAPVARPAPAPPAVEEPPEDKKLSKSAKAKLRKKLREGKA